MSMRQRRLYDKQKRKTVQKRLNFDGAKQESNSITKSGSQTPLRRAGAKLHCEEQEPNSIAYDDLLFLRKNTFFAKKSSFTTPKIVAFP